jgi:hypothetical protein
MSDKTPAGAARITKTMRVTHTVTAGDVAAQAAGNPLHLDAVWDTPFVDLNYTVNAQVEALAPASIDSTFVNAFVRAVDRVTASISITNEGDVIVLHARAIHD